jgi:hypothetical protein
MIKFEVQETLMNKYDFENIDEVHSSLEAIRERCCKATFYFETEWNVLYKKKFGDLSEINVDTPEVFEFFADSANEFEHDWLSRFGAYLLAKEIFKDWELASGKLFSVIQRNKATNNGVNDE